jgi:hypothetical protein
MAPEEAWLRPIVAYGMRVADYLTGRFHHEPAHSPARISWPQPLTHLFDGNRLWIIEVHQRGHWLSVGQPAWAYLEHRWQSFLNEPRWGGYLARIATLNSL